MQIQVCICQEASSVPEAMQISRFWTSFDVLLITMTDGFSAPEEIRTPDPRFVESGIEIIRLVMPPGVALIGSSR
jgi:hypothetical protein